MGKDGMRRKVLALAALVLLYAIIPFAQSVSPTPTPEYYISIGGIQPSTTLAQPSSSTSNIAPVLDFIGNSTIAEGSLLTIPVKASDPDGDTLMFAADGSPEGALFIPNGANYTFMWTPGFDQAGNYDIRFTVIDDGGLIDTENVTITVTNTNRPPVLDAIGPQLVPEGASLSFSFNASDPDGDTLMFAADGVPEGALFIPNGANYTFMWTPGFDQAGNYDIRFTVIDDGGLTDTENVTITVTNTNRPLVLDAIGNKTVAWNLTLSIDINAIDPDNDTLIYSADPLPFGALFNNNTGIFDWTPTSTQNGTYYVNFRVTDTGGLSDYEIVRINVTDEDHPPELDSIGNQTVAENSTLVFTVHATDLDGDGLTYSATPLPLGAEFNRANVFSWTPTYSQNESYSINFTVSDGVLMDYENITIIVLNVAAPPVLNAIGPKVVNEGLLLAFMVNATDPDNNILTYTVDRLPPRATFNASTRVFSWIPSYTEAGTYSINFSVIDVDGLMDSEIVTIVVSQPIKILGSSLNYAPIFDTIEDQTGFETYDISFVVHAFDFDTDNLTYSAISLPPGASFDTKTKIFSWTPPYGGSGSYIVEFMVSDGLIYDILDVPIFVVDQPLPSIICH